MTHTLAGESHSQVLEGDACQGLVAWIAQLEFQPVAFAQGASPGDAEGGEVYGITGDAAFILADGAWYGVQDPPPPPAGGVPAE